MFFVLAAVSLPVPPLKADALTLPNRFFYPVLTFAGFGIPALASLRASQVCQTLLISSFISARGLPGKGCSAARMGAEGGWDVPSNTSLLCQIGSSGVLLKSTRGIPCHPHSPRLAPIPLLSARYPVKGSLRRFAPLTAQAFAAPGRCDGGSGGMTTAGDLFKFKIILFL